MLFIPDDLAYAVRLDISADGIFYADNISAQSGSYLAVFKGKVTILGGAILQNKIFAITEGLGALDVTTDKLQTFGIPAEVLSLDNAIVNGDVLGVPEGILGLEM